MQPSHHFGCFVYQLIRILFRDFWVLRHDAAIAEHTSPDKTGQGKLFLFINLRLPGYIIFIQIKNKMPGIFIFPAIQDIGFAVILLCAVRIIFFGIQPMILVVRLIRPFFRVIVFKANILFKRIIPCINIRLVIRRIIPAQFSGDFKDIIIASIKSFIYCLIFAEVIVICIFKLRSSSRHYPAPHGMLSISSSRSFLVFVSLKIINSAISEHSSQRIYHAYIQIEAFQQEQDIMQAARFIQR